MLGFVPPLSHGSVISRGFSIHIATLSDNQGVPMARQGLTHASSKGREARWRSLSGFPCAMGCSLVLPTMVSSEKRRDTTDQALLEDRGVI